MRRSALLSFLAALPLAALLALSSACSNDDPAGGGTGGSGTAGSGAAGSAGAAGSGAAGTSSGSCVDPRMEASLIPLTAAAGSGVWDGFQIDGDSLYFRDLDGLYAQPLSGGAKTTLLDKGTNAFAVQGDAVRFVSGITYGSVPKTGGATTTLNTLPAGTTAALLLADGLVVHDQSLVDKDGGTLQLLPAAGGDPVAIGTYASKNPPFDFARVGDSLFFSATPVDTQIKELFFMPVAGGSATMVAMPAGLGFRAVIGVVGDSLYAVAEDDFFKNTVLRVNAGGSISATYVPSSGTAMRAFAVPGGVGIGGVQFLDVWSDATKQATRVKCFQVGAGVSSPYPTIHDWAASGSDVFLSIRTPEPNQNAVQRMTLP